MSEKRFRANFDVSIYDSETEEYISASGNGLKEIAKRLNEQQAEIEQLKDDVYDELDKALKVLEEIYEDYPKNNVHRLYNDLKGLKDMIQ